MATLKIIASLAQETESGTEPEEHAALTYDSADHGLVLALENYWRAVQVVAASRKRVPTLLVCNADRSITIAVRADTSSTRERAAHESARTIFEALMKLSEARARQVNTPARERASEAPPRARTSDTPPRASAESTSGTHARARSLSEPPARMSAAPHERSTRR